MHTLIVGRTRCGKTTIGAKLAHGLQSRGMGLIVLTPHVLDKRWTKADFVTDDKYRFMGVVWASRECVCVVDETHMYGNKTDLDVYRLATEGRHYGHMGIFISQRVMSINTNIRENCDNLYLFRSSPHQCKELYDIFVNEAINRAPSLKDYQFIQLIKGQPAKLGNTGNSGLATI